MRHETVLSDHVLRPHASLSRRKIALIRRASWSSPPLDHDPKREYLVAPEHLCFANQLENVSMRTRCFLLCCRLLSTLTHFCYNVCRGNVDDALEKLQAAIDGAVESIQPVEVDPEKEKQLKKQ